MHQLRPICLFQLQNLKQGLPVTNVPAIEDKPKENGQLENSDQLNNSHHKVYILLYEKLIFYIACVYLNCCGTFI